MKATLIKPGSNPVIVEANTPEAQSYFGQWYALQKAPAAPVAPEVSAPTINRPGQYGLSDWRSYQALKDAANEIIKMKNQWNKDLTESSAYWNTLIRDTSPFWGKRAAEAPATAGTFTDERMRELSPSDQASIIASRQAAAGWHLASIEDERRYRTATAGTALWDVKDLYSLQQKAKQDEIDNARAQEALNLQREQSWLWWRNPYWTLSPAWEKSWWSLSWKNNNPWNLKYAKWMEEYGWVKDPNSAFAKFPDEESAKTAYKALLTSPTWIYSKIWDLNEVFKKWSSDYKWDPNAYDYDKLVRAWAPAVSKPLNRFTDTEWSQLFEAQRRLEWWKEWTVITSSAWEKSSISEAQYDTLASKTWMTRTELKGLPVDEVNRIEWRLYDPVYIAISKLPFQDQYTRDAKNAILMWEDPRNVYMAITSAYGPSDWPDWQQKNKDIQAQIENVLKNITATTGSTFGWQNTNTTPTAITK